MTSTNLFHNGCQATCTTVIDIYNRTFKRFGLTIATDKTKTIIFNAREEIVHKESILKLDNETIENVRQFKYLGHMLPNIPSTTPSFITHQISSAYQKWNEMKPILLDRRIH